MMSLFFNHFFAGRSQYTDFHQDMGRKTKGTYHFVTIHNGKATTKYSGAVTKPEKSIAKAS